MKPLYFQKKNQIYDQLQLSISGAWMHLMMNAISRISSTNDSSRMTFFSLPLAEEDREVHLQIRKS